MGTVLKIFNLLFIIHTRDHTPPHVTVYMGTPESWDAKVKVNLVTLKAFDNENFSAKSLKVICQLAKENQDEWMEKWNEIFKDQ